MVKPIEIFRLLVLNYNEIYKVFHNVMKTSITFEEHSLIRGAFFKHNS